MLFSKLYKILVNKFTLVGFRGDRPPMDPPLALRLWYTVTELWIRAVRILADLWKHCMAGRFLEYLTILYDTDRKSLLTVLSRSVGNLLKQEAIFVTYRTRATEQCCDNAGTVHVKRNCCLEQSQAWCDRTVLSDSSKSAASNHLSWQLALISSPCDNSVILNVFSSTVRVFSLQKAYCCSRAMTA